MTSADSERGTDPDVDTSADTEIDADADAPESDDSAESDAAADRPERVSRFPAIALSLSIALVVAAAAVAGWYGVDWFQASNDDGIEFSRTRDEVDRVARSAIITMNTLDYRKLDEGLESWADISTGTLQKDIGKLTADEKKQLKDAKPVTSAEVTSLAVKELDDRGGKATVIAAIEKTVQTGNRKPQPSYQRIQATLLRTKDGWKLENLGPVPYAQPQ